MKPLLLSLIIAFIFTACAKDQICTDGMIHWGGEPAVDGLGWYFTSTELGDRPVKLKNLPGNYLTDSLRVNACLIKTKEKYQCFCATPMDVYEVKSIRKK